MFLFGCTVMRFAVTMLWGASHCFHTQLQVSAFWWPRLQKGCEKGCKEYRLSLCIIWCTLSHWQPKCHKVRLLARIRFQNIFRGSSRPHTLKEAFVTLWSKSATWFLEHSLQATSFSNAFDSALLAWYERDESLVRMAFRYLLGLLHAYEYAPPPTPESPNFYIFWNSYISHAQDC